MPISMENKNGSCNPCLYRSSDNNCDRYVHADCPAELAIRCVNEIILEIGKLDTPTKQEDEFAGIISKYLNKICRDGRSNQEIQVFWSLYEKSKISGKELSPDATSIEILNNVIFNLNKNYHSHRLFEGLTRHEVGSGHIFDIIPKGNRISLKSYYNLKMDKPEGQNLFEYELANSTSEEFTNFISALMEKLENKKKKNIDEKSRLTEKMIRDFCNSWDVAAKGLKEALDKCNEYNADEPVSREVIEDACRHFALMATYTTNNHLSHTTYILAPTFRGQPHSSMVIYWPTLGDGYSIYPHIHFLLHLVLGLNSIQARSWEKEFKHAMEIKSILEHDIKNMYLNIHAIYQNTIEDWTDGILIADEDTQNRFKTMYSNIRLAKYGIGLEAIKPAEGESKIKIITIKKLYDELFLSTRFYNFDVKFDDGAAWKNCERKVDSRVLIPLSNLIDNAKRYSTRTKKLNLIFENKPQECVFKLKSQAPFSNAAAQKAFNEPLQDEMPSKSKGLWICKKIIKQIGGSIKLDMERKNHETVFVITIPWII